MHAIALTLKWGRRLSAMRWRAVSALQVLAWAILLAVLALSSQEGHWHQAPLLHSRSVVQDVADTLRSMHWRVATNGRPLELRIDADRGCLHVVAFEGRNRIVEVVERTLWLPDPLKILEAPAVLRVAPGRPHTQTTLLLAAPGYSRLFRLTLWPDGRVSVHEETTL